MNVAQAFEILGLKPAATADEIKEAYRDLAKVWHPDRFPNDPRLRQRGEETLKRINEAYQTLQDFRPPVKPKDSDEAGQQAQQVVQAAEVCAVCGKLAIITCSQCWDYLLSQFPSQFALRSTMPTRPGILQAATAVQELLIRWRKLRSEQLESNRINIFSSPFEKTAEAAVQSIVLFQKMTEFSQQYPRTTAIFATIYLARDDINKTITDESPQNRELAHDLIHALESLETSIAAALQEEGDSKEKITLGTQTLLKDLSSVFAGRKPVLRSFAVAHALDIYSRFLAVTTATTRTPVAVGYCATHQCHHFVKAEPIPTSTYRPVPAPTASQRPASSENIGAWIIGIALAIGAFSIVIDKLTTKQNNPEYVLEHRTAHKNTTPSPAEPVNGTAPQVVPPAMSAAYLCDLDSYREQMIKNEVEDAEEHGGDNFDKEAARKRILAIPDSTLEAHRQSDLAFTRKVYRDAGKGEVCPGQ